MPILYDVSRQTAFMKLFYHFKCNQVKITKCSNKNFAKLNMVAVSQVHLVSELVTTDCATAFAHDMPELTAATICETSSDCNAAGDIIIMLAPQSPTAPLDCCGCCCCKIYMSDISLRTPGRFWSDVELWSSPLLADVCWTPAKFSMSSTATAASTLLSTLELCIWKNNTTSKADNYAAHHNVIYRVPI